MNLRETWRQFIILFEVSSTYDIFMRFFIFSSFAIARMHARICTHLQTVYVFWALFSFYLSCESVCAVYRLCIAQSTTPPPSIVVVFSGSIFSYFGSLFSFTFMLHVRPLVRRISLFYAIYMHHNFIHYILSCLSISIRFWIARNSVSLLSRNI